MTSQLTVTDLQINYAGTSILQHISFSLEAGEIACLVGPSGCGKTSLLRAIAGFEPISAGQIELRGRIVSGPDKTLPPEQRHIGMVFQDFALFPHLTVAQNIAFGLRKMPRGQRRQRVDELLKLVEMQDTRNHYPTSFPAASNSASHWRAPWRRARIS